MGLAERLRMEALPANPTLEFYKLAAQILPVLWLAAIVEARVLDDLRTNVRTAEGRIPRPLSVGALGLLLFSAVSEAAALWGVAVTNDHWLVTAVVVVGLALGGALVLLPSVKIWVTALVDPLTNLLRYLKP